MLTALIEDTFSSTIDFLNHKCQPILSADLPASISSNYRIVDGIQEVSSFLRILSALCDKFLVHEVEGSETDSPAAGKFNLICGVLWLSSLVHWTQALVLSAAEGGFESWS